MPEKNTHYISTLRGTLIILVVAGVAISVFGFLYYYWIENPRAMKIPEIFDLSRAAKVNLNANLKPYLSQNQGNTCQKDSDCPTDYVCYTSRECINTNSGSLCGAEQGDLLCHQKCANDSDCPTSMPSCEQTNFFIGEAPVLIKICRSD